MQMLSAQIIPNTRWTFLRRLLPLLAILLSGCGGGGGGTGTATDGAAIVGEVSGASAETVASTLNVTITGSVGDGPVTGATVTVYDAGGAVVGSMVSDASANFARTVQVKGSQYPLRLVVSGGIDLVTGRAPDFKMTSVMLRPSDKAVNINPFSTMITGTAQRMPGGLTGTNVNRARTAVLDKLGFGLDTTTVPDPVTTKITTSNAANIVKASEALGELVRRTRDLILATGQSASGSGVIAALSADLVDGFIDGLGASGTSATVSAVANVVSAQVLVEAMSNNLRVGGVIATSVIDQSIRSTHAGIGTSQLSGSVRINGQMIRQAGIALAAVQVLDSSTTVKGIAQTVAGLNANSTAATIARLLPSDTTKVLAPAVNQVAGTSSANLTRINQLVFAQTDTGTQTTTSGGTSPGGSTTTGTTATGSFSLRWTAPVARNDGTSLPLSSIGGYRIYYGNKTGNYPSRVNITDASANSATVSNLASGSYYVVMTTVDTAGIESRYSGEVVKNVP